jgi:hypothetical protein
MRGSAGPAVIRPGPDPDKPSNSRGVNTGLVLGAGLGVTIGILLGGGAALGVGIAVGAGLGVAVGSAWPNSRHPTA